MHFKRDDKKAGEFLNQKLSQFSEADYRDCEGYYYGNPIQLAFCFFQVGESNAGIIGEVAIASDGFIFSKKKIKEMLALFFEKDYRRIRLQALITPENGQAIRLNRLCGFQYEGRLREVAKDGDRLIFAILRREYVKLIQISESTRCTRPNQYAESASAILIH